MAKKNGKCPLSGKLINHGETLKYKTVTSLRGSCWRKLNFRHVIAESSRKKEVALSIVICQHSSKNSVEHLTEL